MIRVTPDTNILVSAFFFDGNERGVLEAALQRRIRFVPSSELIEELIQVLDSKFRVEWEMLWAYVFRLNEVAEIVKPKRLADSTVRDRSDVKVQSSSTPTRASLASLSASEPTSRRIHC